MAQEQKKEAVRPAELGRSFEAQSSPSFGGDLGTAFEEHNSSREEYEKGKHRTRRRLLWIGGVLLLLAVGAIIFFGSKPKKGAAPASLKNTRIVPVPGRFRNSSATSWMANDLIKGLRRSDGM